MIQNNVLKHNDLWDVMSCNVQDIYLSEGHNCSHFHNAEDWNSMFF